MAAPCSRPVWNTQGNLISPVKTGEGGEPPGERSLALKSGRAFGGGEPGPGGDSKTVRNEPAGALRESGACSGRIELAAALVWPWTCGYNDNGGERRGLCSPRSDPTTTERRHADAGGRGERGAGRRRLMPTFPLQPPWDATARAHAIEMEAIVSVDRHRQRGGAISAAPYEIFSAMASGGVNKTHRTETVIFSAPVMYRNPFSTGWGD